MPSSLPFFGRSISPTESKISLAEKGVASNPPRTAAGMSAYGKAAVVFVATTATFLLAKTTGLLPSWLWSKNSDTKPASENNEHAVTVTKNATAVVQASSITIQQTPTSGSVVVASNPVPLTITHDEAMSPVEFIELPLSRPKVGAEQIIVVPELIQKSNNDSKENSNTQLISSQPLRDDIFTTSATVNLYQPNFSMDLPAEWFGETDPSSIVNIEATNLPDWLMLQPPILRSVNSLQAINNTIAGSANAIAISGNYALVAAGTEVRILDITDILNPQLIHIVPTNNAQGIAVFGNFALIADENKWIIMNITDITNSFLINSFFPASAYTYENPVNAIGVAIKDNFALLPDSSNSQIIIVNMTNIFNLTQVHVIPFDLSDPQNIVIQDNRGFITGETIDHTTDSIATLNLNNLLNPFISSFNQIDGSAYEMPTNSRLGLNVKGRYVVILGDYSGISGYDIFNISNPKIVGKFQLNNACGIAFKDSYALVAVGDEGIKIIQLIFSNWQLRAKANRIPGYLDSFQNNIVLTSVNQNGQIQSIQLSLAVKYPPIVSSPLNNQTCSVGNQCDISFSPSPFLDPDGDAIFFHKRGLSFSPIIPWLVPSCTPKIFGSYNDEATISGLAVNSDLLLALALVTDSGKKEAYLKLISIANPHHPAVIQTYIPENRPELLTGVSTVDNYAFLIGAGLEIVDISDPKNPQHVNTIADVIAYNVVTTLFRNQYRYALIGNSFYSITVFNITDMSHLEQLGSVTISTKSPTGIAMQDPYALVAEGYQMDLIDFTDLTNPFSVSNLTEPFVFATDVAIAGINLAAVTDNYYGLYMVDFSNPKSLKIVGKINTFGANRVAINSNYALLVNNDFTLKIVDIIDPENPMLIVPTNPESLILDGSDLPVLFENEFFITTGYSGFNIINFGVSTWGVTGTPPDNTHARYVVDVTACDDYSLCATNSFVLGVNNKIPQLQINITDQAAAIGQPFQFTLPPSTFIDPDGDTLTYQVFYNTTNTTLSWLRFNPPTLEFRNVANVANFGNYSIAVQVDDGYAGTSNIAFKLVVKHAIQYRSGNLPRAQIGQAYNGEISSFFNDIDNYPLAFQLAYIKGDIIPFWSNFSLQTDGSFTGIPDNYDVGIYSFTVKAYCIGLESSNNQTKVTIVVNSAPKVVTPIPNQLVSLWEDPPATIPMGGRFSDPDGDDLNYNIYLEDGSGKNQPQSIYPLNEVSWAKFDNQTKFLSIFPDLSSYRFNVPIINITAYDNYNGITSSSFYLNIDYLTPLTNRILQYYTGSGGAFALLGLITLMFRQKRLHQMKDVLATSPDRPLLMGLQTSKVSEEKSAEKSTSAAGDVKTDATSDLKSEQKTDKKTENSWESVKIKIEFLKDVMDKKDDTQLEKSLDAYIKTATVYFSKNRQKSLFDIGPYRELLFALINEIEFRVIRQTEYSLLAPWIRSLEKMIRLTVVYENDRGRGFSQQDQEQLLKTVRGIQSRIDVKQEQGRILFALLGITEEGIVNLVNTRAWDTPTISYELIEATKMVTAPPYGIISLLWNINNIPSSWFLDWVQISELFTQAIQASPATAKPAIETISQLLEGQTDWRIIYMTVRYLSEIASITQNEGVREKAEEKIFPYRHFNKFWTQRCKCTFFCQDRGGWIQELAGKNEQPISSPAMREGQYMRLQTIGGV